MFSVKEKQEISAAIEKILLDLDHPEMPKERPSFSLRVNGKEEWSWAVIVPNWTFDGKPPYPTNPWNERAREFMAEAKKVTEEKEKNE